MNNNRFFIKHNYKPNNVCESFDLRSGGLYWNTARVYSSTIYQYPVYRYAEKTIKEREIETVVDLGCGSGKKLERLIEKNPHLSVYGVDQQAGIEFCQREYAFGTWRVDDFENPRLSVDDFGRKLKLVICCDVIEHLMNPDTLLEYIHRVSSKEDCIVISTPERDCLRGIDCNHSPNKQHIREWNKAEFKLYLENRGFQIIEEKLFYPIKIGFNRVFFKDIIRRLYRRKAFKYNQTYLIKVK